MDPESNQVFGNNSYDETKNLDPIYPLNSQIDGTYLFNTSLKNLNEKYNKYIEYLGENTKKEFIGRVMDARVRYHMMAQQNKASIESKNFEQRYPRCLHTGFERPQHTCFQTPQQTPNFNTLPNGSNHPFPELFHNGIHPPHGFCTPPAKVNISAQNNVLQQNVQTIQPMPDHNEKGSSDQKGVHSLPPYNYSGQCSTRQTAPNFVLPSSQSTFSGLNGHLIPIPVLSMSQNNLSSINFQPNIQSVPHSKSNATQTRRNPQILTIEQILDTRHQSPQLSKAVGEEPVTYLSVKPSNHLVQPSSKSNFSGLNVHLIPIPVVSMNQNHLSSINSQPKIQSVPNSMSNSLSNNSGFYYSTWCSSHSSQSQPNSSLISPLILNIDSTQPQKPLFQTQGPSEDCHLVPLAEKSSKSLFQSPPKRESLVMRCNSSISMLKTKQDFIATHKEDNRSVTLSPHKNSTGASLPRVQDIETLESETTMPLYNTNDYNYQRNPSPKVSSRTASISLDSNLTNDSGFRSDCSEISNQSQVKDNHKPNGINDETAVVRYPSRSPMSEESASCSTPVVMYESRKDSRLVCDWPDCNRVFFNEDILTHHRRNHIRKSLYSCEFCSTRLLSKDELYNHMKKHVLKTEPDFDKEEEEAELVVEKKEMIQSSDHIIDLENSSETVNLSNKPPVLDPLGPTLNSMAAMNSIQQSDRVKRNPITFQTILYKRLTQKLSPPAINCPNLPMRDPSKVSPQMRTDEYKGSHHLDECRYRCPWPDCSYSPYFLCDLRTHMFKHTGHKKHKCDYPGCDFKSVWKSSVYTHRRNKHSNVNAINA